MRGAQANGEQIQAARLTRGLTQEQLASLAGVDVRTVRKAERGQRVDLSTLTRMSFSLDVDVSHLIVTTRSPQELEIRRRDAVRRWHHAWDAQDIEAMLSVYHENAVVLIPGAPDIPFAGEHCGKEAIRRAHEIAWNMCETEAMWSQDFNLLVSDDTLVLSGKKGLRLPDGRTIELWFHQIFTFHEDSALVVSQRVECDTLNFSRLMQLPPAAGAATTEKPSNRKEPESFR